MSLLKTVVKHILYQKPQSPPNLFAPGIEDRPNNNGAGQNRDQQKDQHSETNVPPQETDNRTAETGESPVTKRTAGKRTHRKRKKNNPIQSKYAGKIAEDRDIDKILHTEIQLTRNLDKNKEILEKIFRVPQNKDAVFRLFSIGTDPPVKAMLIFIDGITNARVQNTAVLQPLMLLPGLRDLSPQKHQGSSTSPEFENFFEQVKQALLPNNQVSETETYDRIAVDVLAGNSALLIDGYDKAFLLETKGWQFRAVSPPQVEAVIRGPQEGFTELLRVNTALVRKIIQKPALVTEFIKIGNSSPMQCAIMYMDDLANPSLVKEVKRRLASVRGDFVQETGLLEQMIEDAPFYPAPQVLATERPDRVAANLMEGKVAILTNGSPFVLVAPCTFFSLMQAPEDAYVRWPFGSFTRLIRYAGLFLALLLPAHYVAIVAYHQEFIPTDLLLVMTGAREKVPFPSIVEVLVMEISFELIREAGIRIPGTVGTTLGIVGALILGQAAVAANIVSPILIIVVAVTALGSFALPNYSFSLSIRILRFVYIIFASLLGLLGILVGVFLHLGFMVSMKSFGVPFLAPVVPVTGKGRDNWLRGMQWQQEKRPDYIDPLKTRRQPPISRRWLQSRNGQGGTGQE